MTSIVIDFRSQDDFIKGHISKAMNIVVDTPPLNSHQLNKLYIELDFLNLLKDTLIILYCTSGKRAKIAEDYFIKNGYTTVVNMGSFENIKKKTNYNICICETNKFSDVYP